MIARASLVAIALAACGNAREKPAQPPPQKIRVAVVGGLVETGLWPAIAAHYERLTGNTIEVAATGPKHQVVAAFRRGGIDLITVHASDAMVNLVADGLARDPQPWVRNDLVIVGPAADPAGIRGERDAVAALRKLVAANAKLLVHASHGADGVLRDLCEAGSIALGATTVLFEGEDQHALLQRAAELGAYTLVGRIPLVMKKVSAPEIEIMVQGDPRLRRPYLVEIAANASEGAIDLARFLRQRDVQSMLETFGKGKYDAGPLFFPVVVAK